MSIRSPSGNCPICSTYRTVLQRDRIIPAFKGGTYTRKNIQYICANCHQDKTSKEQRESHLGKKLTAEHKRKIGDSNKGKLTGRIFSKEHIEKIRLAPNRAAKISAALKGRSFSPKHIEALRLSRQRDSFSIDELPKARK